MFLKVQTAGGCAAAWGVVCAEAGPGAGGGGEGGEAGEAAEDSPQEAGGARDATCA
jgi:hypothetical protein